MDENQARFRERLARMEQAGAGAQKRKDEALQMARQHAAAASRKKMQAIMVLMLGLLIIAGAIGMSLKGAGDDAVQVAEASAFAPPQKAAPSMFELQPMNTLASGRSEPQIIEIADTGRIFHAPAVLNESRDEVMMDALASGYQPPNAQTSLGLITMVDRNETCTVRPLESGEKVVGVRLQSTEAIAPLFGFFDEELGARLQKSVVSAIKNKDRFGGFQPVNGEFGLVDVLLTDTTAPLYLVLQSNGGNILWNLQLAEGVLVAHVVMISRNASALVGAPEGAGVEALRSFDFVQRDEFGSNDEQRDCMIVPWRQPLESWPAYQKGERQSGLFRNMMETYSKGFAAYNTWYSGAIGADANTNTLTAKAAAHVLLGPRPAPLLTYVPLDGQAVWLSRIDNIFPGDETSRQAAVQQRHADVLQAAIGGDVALLWPDAIERPQP